MTKSDVCKYLFSLNKQCHVDKLSVDFSFSRSIVGADSAPEDFDLSQKYYLQFGTGDTARGIVDTGTLLNSSYGMMSSLHHVQTQLPLITSLSTKMIHE